MSDKAKQVHLMPLVKVMQELLTPESGCPWDQAQTHQSLRKHVIEEAYEVAEAIDSEGPAYLCEELGDLLYQIVFHAALAEQAGHFTLQDVIDGITEKMIRRHPHVYGAKNVEGEEAVCFSWEQIKLKEDPEKDFLMNKLPLDLPALMKAQKFFAKAQRVGCPLSADTLLAGQHPLALSLAGSLDPSVDAEQALSNSVEGAMARFRALEDLARKAGITLTELDETAWQTLWAKAGKVQEEGI